MNETLASQVRYILWKAVRMRFPDRNEDRDAALVEMALSTLRAVPHLVAPYQDSLENTDECAKEIAADGNVWFPGEGIIDLADTALGLDGDDKVQIQRWGHQYVSVLDKTSDVEPPSMELLSDCAVEYLKDSWADSPSLELWLTRQLIFTETYAFSRQEGLPVRVKSVKFWWMWGTSMAKLLVGLAVAYAVGEKYSAAVGVLTYVVWITCMKYLAVTQSKRLVELSKLFDHMRNAYVMTLRSFPCPVEIDNAVGQAELVGAVWPTGLHSLLERALARSRVRWSSH